MLGPEIVCRFGVDERGCWRLKSDTQFPPFGHSVCDSVESAFRESFKFATAPWEFDSRCLSVSVFEVAPEFSMLDCARNGANGSVTTSNIAQRSRHPSIFLGEFRSS